MKKRFNGLPGFADAVGHWSLPGKYVNEQYQYSSSCTSYRVNSALLDIAGQNLATACWYVNKVDAGTVGVNANLHFSNGQYVSVTAMGIFSVFRPTISLSQGSNVNPSFYVGQTLYNYLPYVKLGGDADPRTDGAHNMQYYIVYNAGKYSGSGGIEQLLTMDYSGPTGPVFSDWRLDGNTVMYATGPVAPHTVNDVFFQDSPSNGHVYFPWGTIRCEAHFMDYCMFQPNGGIPVTLGIVTWSCDGESPDAGILSVNSVVGPDGPDGSDEFPLWLLNYPEGSNH